MQAIRRRGGPVRGTRADPGAGCALASAFTYAGLVLNAKRLLAGVSTAVYMTAEWVVALPVNRYVIMIIICLIYELGGSFIDDLTFMILATPIFYPVALKLGFSPLWFGIMIAVVDTPEKIQLAVDAVASMLEDGLIAVSDTSMIRLVRAAAPPAEVPDDSSRG